MILTNHIQRYNHIHTYTITNTKNNVLCVFTFWVSCYLCLSEHSGVQHTLNCVFVLFFFVLYTLWCQFFWIVLFWLPLRYSLTSIWHVIKISGHVTLILQCTVTYLRTSHIHILIHINCRDYVISVKLLLSGNGSYSWTRWWS